MKKSILKILTLIFFTTSLSFASDNLFSHNYSKSLKTAQKEDKILMLMISQPGCPMCIYMKNNTLKDKNVTTYLRKYFQPVEVELGDKTYPEKFDTFVTPTFFFIDPKTQEAIEEPFRGGAKVPAFLELLKEYKEEKEEDKEYD